MLSPGDQGPRPLDPRPGFRHDIEGLRAVAILLVAGFHIWAGRVSGGVDVFLMVSGYFVVGGLLRRYERGERVLLRAYVTRLIRRLLPSAALVLATVAVATALFLPLHRWADVATEILASGAYYENWLLAARGASYGAAESSISPLQHFWSLSVQGQLFVGLPLLLALVGWAATRFSSQSAYRVVVVTVAVAAVASFVYAAWLVAVDQELAYYDTFARAWEYLAGAMLALVSRKVTLPSAARGPMGWLGLGLILATGVVLDGGALFPGPATLLPLTGAALVILAGSRSTRLGVDRLLGSAPLSKAGSYAYELYLWHWPVLIFVMQLVDPDVGILSGTAVLLISAALALATKRLTSMAQGEVAASPLDRSWYRGTVAVGLIVAVTLPAIFLVYRAVRVSTVQQGLLASDIQTYPGALAAYDPGAWTVPADVDPIPDLLTAPTNWDPAVDDGCMSGWGDVSIRRCSFGELGSDRSMILVGGSHSEHWLPPLQLLAAEHGFRLDVLLKSGCPFTSEPPEEECGVWQQGVLAEISQNGYDYVFTTGTRPGNYPGDEFVPEGYLDVWKSLERQGQRVIAIRDTPWYDPSPLDCVGASGNPSTDCVVPRDSVLQDENPLANVQLPSNVQVLDLNDILCPGDVCPAVIGNRVVYRDWNHLTATFSVTLAPALGDRLTELIGWW